MESKPYYSSSSSSRTASVTIDPDEIEALIKSIRVVQEKILPSSPGNYTEVIFKSRAGFEPVAIGITKKLNGKPTLQ